MSDETTPAADDAPTRPALRIVRGNPDDVDIAVIAAVLSAAGGGEPDTAAPTRDLWGSPEQRLRPSWAPAPTGFLNVHFSH
ncbi:MAG: acyl-CoA carboxylase subunit epsilon [Gordonia paraffinivorans]